MKLKTCQKDFGLEEESLGNTVTIDIDGMVLLG